MAVDPIETMLYIALGVLLVVFVTMVVALLVPSLVRRLRESRHARVSNARRAANTGIDLFSAPSGSKSPMHRAKRRSSRWGSSKKRNQKIDLFDSTQE
jgi:hypothetical protein